MDTPTSTTIDLEVLLRIKNALLNAGAVTHVHAINCEWLNLQSEAAEASSLSEELFNCFSLAADVYYKAFPIPF